jgi:hypothetical protein
MTQPAFKATFSDFKLVKTRSVAQFVFEVPIEAAGAALEALGGLPRPDAEVWAGIARIQDGPTNALEAPQRPDAARRFHDLPLPQQAALRCRDMDFRTFLRDVKQVPAINAAEAAESVRSICHVTSRSQFALDDKAAARWRRLNLTFELWMAAEKHGVSA